MKKLFGENIDADCIMVSVFYCFDILPKERRTLLDLKKELPMALFDKFFAGRTKGPSYRYGEIDEVDKELFFENYLENMPFLRRELRPEEILLEIGTSKLIKCKVRTHVTIWQSGFLLVTMSLCFMKETMYGKLVTEAKKMSITLMNLFP